MFVGLTLSSVATGVIATTVMLIFLYLPLIWTGNHFDILAAIGSVVTKKVNARSRFLGGIIYFLFGILFSFLYGLLALSVLQNYEKVTFPGFVIPGTPIEINLIFIIFGVAVGLGHGIVVALLATIVLIEHHPLEQFHTKFILVLSQLISHVAFGLSAMFFQSQFLQLFLAIK